MVVVCGKTIHPLVLYETNRLTADCGKQQVKKMLLHYQYKRTLYQLYENDLTLKII